MNYLNKLQHLPTLLTLALSLAASPAIAQVGVRLGDAPGAAASDKRLEQYFEDVVQGLARVDAAALPAAEWKELQSKRRGELLEMLGLSPLPPRTDLQAEVTGVVEQDELVVEKVHFQSKPGLYVTGNLYRPKDQSKPLPAVLYVCGHGNVRIDGVSYGSKAHYQHHGAWFARNGYVCLTIDTLQLGEIEGIHHGTYRYDRWWWVNRGYSPAGVEAWNCVRALDYLQSRKEVDGGRLGVTGRSGGGAYSWWIAAIDERIQAAVPVAGITDLENHVTDGCVEGHCDCMYFVNTYQWDYPVMASLVAPRPLLISNTDADRIFPLDGVVRTHREVRDAYQLLDAQEKLALQITAGPHKDTQELRVHAFRWFNHFLRDDDALLRMPAEKLFDPKDLKVFQQLPSDELNTTIDESFVPAAEAGVPPENPAAWKQLAQRVRATLLEKSFRGWPAGAVAPKTRTSVPVRNEGLQWERLTISPQPHVELEAWIVRAAGERRPDNITLRIVDSDQWSEVRGALSQLFPQLAADDMPAVDLELAASLRTLAQSRDAVVYFSPRGMGKDAWTGNAKKQNQIRRRFYLVGQTLDGMRVWDVQSVMAALPKHLQAPTSALRVEANGLLAGIALHAGLFQPCGQMDLYDPPTEYREGPTLLNVSRFVTLAETMAAVAQGVPVRVHHDDLTTAETSWSLPLAAAAAMPEKLQDRFQLRQPAADQR